MCWCNSIVVSFFFTSNPGRAGGPWIPCRPSSPCTGNAYYSGIKVSFFSSMRRNTMQTSAVHVRWICPCYVLDTNNVKTSLTCSPCGPGVPGSPFSPCGPGSPLGPSSPWGPTCPTGPCHASIRKSNTITLTRCVFLMGLKIRFYC